MPTAPLDFDEGDYMQVKEALRNFADGESRNRIFFSPDIPIKKLNNAYSKYITRDEEVLVLVDDTLFGSAKDGLAVSEKYLYAKGTLEDFKSVKLSSIRRLASQSNKLGSLDIYVNGNLFITLSTIDKADHEFLISILQTAKDAATKGEKRNEKAAQVTAVPSPPRPKPKAKPQTVASEEPLSCDECSSTLPKGSKFCLECGAKVMPKGMCLQCNAKLPENAKFCAECGTPVRKQSGAKVALPEAVGPRVDVDAARKELAELLANADKDVSIDSDGDIRINFTTKRVPALASKFRGSAMTYSIKVTSEGQTEEDDNRDARFNPTDDGVWFGGPYVRVGRLPSAHYEAVIDASIWAASNLEVHEVKLKEGKLDAPTLGSSRIALTSLKATKDDSDGSFGVEYELNAYPENYIHFEIVTEKPGEDADLWPSMDAEGRRSGNSWLYDVKPGETVYLAFAEYEKIAEGVTATLSGTAEPIEGFHDDADEVAEPSTSLMEVSLRDVEGDEHIYWVEMDELPSGEDEVDWAIERARVYHAENVGTEPAEEDEDDLPVTAYEPFDRSEGEYTLVKSLRESDLIEPLEDKLHDRMRIRLDLRINNADSYETVNRSIEVEISDEKVMAMGWVCESRPTEDTFKMFLRALYDNQTYKAPTGEDANVGVAYNEIWDNLSHFAFNKLGWHDVTVDVNSLSIDGVVTKLSEMIEMGMIDNSPSALQLTRDGYMYCYD